MKTILDEITRDEVIARINLLDENSKALWGKMTVYQMARHCTQWEEMILGKKKFKRVFLGYLFGKMALNDLLKDNKPMKKNLPTAPGFRVKDEGEFLTEKLKWIALIEQQVRSSNIKYPHSFFGNMSREQTGRLAYKHFDHHLRQFNV